MIIERMYEFEPTSEQAAQAEALKQADDEAKARFQEEMKTTFNNTRCPICGHRFMSGAVCRKAGGSVCMSHCKSCPYLNTTFWHCLYKNSNRRRNYHEQLPIKSGESQYDKDNAPG